MGLENLNARNGQVRVCVKLFAALMKKICGVIDLGQETVIRAPDFHYGFKSKHLPFDCCRLNDVQVANQKKRPFAPAG